MHKDQIATLYSEGILQWEKLYSEKGELWYKKIGWEEL